MSAICDACDSEPCLCDTSVLCAICGQDIDNCTGECGEDEDECPHDTEHMEGEVLVCSGCGIMLQDFTGYTLE